MTTLSLFARLSATLFLVTWLAACGGGSSSTSGSETTGSGPVAAASNVTTVRFQRWPSTAQVNAPFVSVTLCVPGTSTCQTVDHILLDTGSYGLRVHASALTLESALPVATNSAGKALGSCGQFASGYTWGSVRRADVQISGESADNLPIQVIADSGADYSTTPSACQNTGSNFGSSTSTLGANGILGVGFLTYDCGITCTTSTAPAFYYACSNGACASTVVALSNQVANPIPSFAQNNNGLTLVVPSVALGQQTKSLYGSLVFGVGTQSNNQISNSAAVLPTSVLGRFTTVYRGTTYTDSFIDSGSNGIFFEDSLIADCGFYCPDSTLALSAEVHPYSGGMGRTIDFWVENVQDLPSTTVASHLAGDGNMSNVFDWGAPFFFGRTVHLVMPGRTVSGQTGPFWAF